MAFIFGLVLIVLAIWAVVAFLLKDDSEGIDAVGIESQAKGEMNSYPVLMEKKWMTSL